jgi:hypothetical protein
MVLRGVSVVKSCTAGKSEDLGYSDLCDDHEHGLRDDMRRMDDHIVDQHLHEGCP